MTRAVLDRSRREPAETLVELDRVPKAVRKEKLYPDISVLQPGDVLLVSPVEPSFVARMIIWGQGQVHAEDDAIRMHAALYLGDNAVVEIDGGGVTVSPLFKYVLTHKMLFRRVLDSSGADIDRITGYGIAVAALKQFKPPYAYANIAVTAFDCLSIRTKPGELRAIRGEGAICSDFVNEVVFATTNRPAAPVERLPLQPTDLSNSALMRDVVVGWGRLV